MMNLAIFVWTARDVVGLVMLGLLLIGLMVVGLCVAWMRLVKWWKK